MKNRSLFAPLLAALAITACAPTSLPPEEGEQRAAVAHLKEAGRKTLPAEERAALYLASAAEAEDLLGSPASGAAAREVYNRATTDLTVLLHSADGGRLWNRPLTLQSGGQICGCALPSPPVTACGIRLVSPP